MAVLHLAAFAEQRVGFVEQEDSATGLGRFEHCAQVFLGFANIFRDYARKIDAIKIEAEIVGDDFCRHRLARAARPRQQHRYTAASRVFSRKAVVAVYSGLVTDLRGRRSQVLDDMVG